MIRCGWRDPGSLPAPGMEMPGISSDIHDGIGIYGVDIFYISLVRHEAPAVLAIRTQRGFDEAFKVRNGYARNSAVGSHQPAFLFE